MLASPKAQALVENFAGQWLEIRNLQVHQLPIKLSIPISTKACATRCKRKPRCSSPPSCSEDRSVVDFVNGDYTFVNERLARHYGIPNVTGPEFRRVSLEGTPRRGVLTQASVLTLTSNPTRTSPVKRGKWVLEDLLGTPPPPPPPDVPPLKEDAKNATGTLRQQMEEHRANPVCASCHARMDPIGFGLENFDGIGAYRTKEGQFPIDSSGKLTSGESFQGASELSNILATSKRDQFVRCLTEKMMIYALGRGLEYYDRAATDQISTAVDEESDKVFLARAGRREERCHSKSGESGMRRQSNDLIGIRRIDDGTTGSRAARAGGPRPASACPAARAAAWLAPRPQARRLHLRPRFHGSRRRAAGQVGQDRLEERDLTPTPSASSGPTFPLSTIRRSPPA